MSTQPNANILWFLPTHGDGRYLGTTTGGREVNFNYLRQIAQAADQLGSDQAPVRLAGLYALERLAHSTVEHRQTMVDVICAYLRMPYTPPEDQPAEDAPPKPWRRIDHRLRWQREAVEDALA